MLPGIMLRISPVTILSSFPNWTEMAEADENVHTGLLPNLPKVAFEKRSEQLVGMTLGTTGWFIDTVNDTKLSLKSTETT